jgi:hypothetical protein
VPSRVKLNKRGQLFIRPHNKTAEYFFDASSEGTPVIVKE